MRRCEACGNEFRKGSRATVLTPSGFSNHIVCPHCALDGVLLVPLRRAPLPPKPAPARDIAQLLHKLRVLSTAAAATKITQSEDEAFWSGRLSGLDSAIELVKRELLP